MEKELRLLFTAVSEIKDMEPEWLIRGFVPKGRITALTGDRESGKTALCCALAASVSSGEKFFLDDSPEKREPGKALVLNSETPLRRIKQMLEESGANLDNVYTMCQEDGISVPVKFGSHVLEGVVEKIKPELIVFDSALDFLPAEYGSGEFSDIDNRESLRSLIRLAKKFHTAVILVVPSNQNGENAWSRQRFCGIEDLWKASDSVLVTGVFKTLHYLSQEKNSYTDPEKTVIFQADKGRPVFEGLMNSKDKYFVLENSKKNS